MKPQTGIRMAIVFAAALVGGYFATRPDTKSPATPESPPPVKSEPSRAAPTVVRNEPAASPAPPLRREEIKPGAPIIDRSPAAIMAEAAARLEPRLQPPRVAPDEPLLPGFTGPASWRNLGTATASAAFETHCWAIDHGDPDVLLSTVNPSPAARAKLKLIFDQLPAADQAQYGSPERMLGMIWVYHGLPFPGFMIQSENVRSPTEIGVILQLQYSQRGADREFVFTREADGWRKVTPDAQIDDFLRMTGISPNPRK